MLNNVKILHIESTDACNAACPQCAREFDSAFDKTNLHHLTVNQLKSLLSKENIRNLDKMFMCGVYGDPAAGKHTLDIFKYVRSINPTIILGMNTNGGLRTTAWWQELASILNQPQDYVVWSIDGLEDTNHIYRVNVNWDTVVRNAKAFVQAGGNAHWDMLVFAHNEHQIDLSEQYAKELGFKYFRSKVSRRFDIVPIEFLNPPATVSLPKKSNGAIDCLALKESSVYISAQGNVHPCCWLGTVGGPTSDQFDSIVKSWASASPNGTCQQTCGKTAIGNSFTDQWQREVNFV